MTAALSVTGLGKRYGEIVVAEDLSFAVETGTCLGVIGPNGAGKTSVFNMLDGTVRPDAGQVLLDGRDVTRLKQFQRARLGIARAYQIPQPFPMLTVYENVLAAASFGAGQQGQEAADTAMRVLQTTGLDRLGGVLAGGLALLDRKRLELAKALAARPRVLLLDEIAGGLTEREVHLLVDLVRGLKREVAMIWIEHVAHALTATADRLLVLHYGRKVMEGPVAATLASPEVREIYLGIRVDAAS